MNESSHRSLAGGLERGKQAPGVSPPLIEVHSRFQAVLEATTQVAIIGFNPEGLITEFNPTAEKMLGYTADQVVGKENLTRFFLESELSERAGELSALIHKQVQGIDILLKPIGQGSQEDQEWILVGKNGEQTLVTLKLSALRNLQLEIIGFVGVAMDITAKKQVQKMVADQAVILDLVDDSVLICDLADRIAYWNNGASRLYGWTKEEAVGQTIRNLLKTKFPFPLEQIKERLYRDNRWEGELEHSHRDGRRLIVVSRWNLQRGAGQEPVGIIEMNTDITARKKAERSLAESQARLQAVLASSLDGIVVYEAVRDDNQALQDLRFSLINPAAESLLEQKAEDLLGELVSVKFPTVFSGGLFARFKSIVETNTPLDFEHLSLRLDLPRWYRIAGVKLGDGLAISFSDITARKLNEEKLREAKRLAEVASQAKNDFLANMSHEIRTPMNGILGFTQLLTSKQPGPLNDLQSEYLGDIIECSHRLLSLINNILEVAQAGSGSMTLQAESFSLSELVDEVWAELSAPARQKGINLVAEIRADPETLYLDRYKTRQILFHLVSNAIKFSPSGESVTLSAEPQGPSKFKLRIRDHGIGIKTEDLERLFKVFEQGQSGNTRNYEGAGLGLSLAQKFTEIQQGQLSVESVLGQGSIFIVILPTDLRLKRS